MELKIFLRLFFYKQLGSYGANTDSSVGACLFVEKTKTREKASSKRPVKFLRLVPLLSKNFSRNLSENHLFLNNTIFYIILKRAMHLYRYIIIFYLLICLLLATNSLQLQAQFQRNLNGSEIASRYIGTTTSDGGYIIAGPAFQPTATEFSPVKLAKCDAAGNVIWAYEYDWEGVEMVAHIEEKADGSLLLAGACEMQERDQALAALFTADGDLQWAKIIGFTDADVSSRYFTSAKTGSAYWLGLSLSGAWNTFEDGEHSVVLELDKNGQTIRGAAIQSTGDDQLCSIHPINNNHIILTATTQIKGKINSDLLAFELDDTFGLEWAYNYASNGDETLYGSALHRNDRIVLTGATNYFYEPTDSVDAFLVELDKNGDLNWSYTYNSGQNEIARHLQVASNGDLVITGFHQHQTPSLQDAFWAKFDNNGNLLTANQFGHPSCKDFGLRLSELSDGYWGVFGYSLQNHLDTNYYSPYFLKLDADGNNYCLQHNTPFDDSRFPIKQTDALLEIIPIFPSITNNFTEGLAQIGDRRILEWESSAWCNVWPGDTDNDGQVNHFDLLPLGKTYNFQGGERPNASLAWQPQPFLDTLAQFPLGNSSSVDCDGNAIVDATDQEAIILNYGKSYTSPLLPPSAPEIEDFELFAEIQDTIIENYEFDFAIHLGTAEAPARNIYALAFSPRFELGNPSEDEGIVLNQPFVSFEDSWLHENQTVDLLTLDTCFADQGVWDIAQTRTNQTVVTQAHGTVSDIVCIMEISSFKTTTEEYIPIDFIIDNIQIAGADGQRFSLPDFKQTLYLKRATSPNLTLDVYPSPANTFTTVTFNSQYPEEVVTFQLYDVTGSLLLEQSLVTQQGFNRYRLDLAPYPNGAYFIRIRQSDKQRVDGRFVIIR